MVAVCGGSIPICVHGTPNQHTRRGKSSNDIFSCVLLNVINERIMILNTRMSPLPGAKYWMIPKVLTTMHSRDFHHRPIDPQILKVE